MEWGRTKRDGTIRGSAESGGPGGRGGTERTGTACVTERDGAQWKGTSGTKPDGLETGCNVRGWVDTGRDGTGLKRIARNWTGLMERHNTAPN